MNSTEFLLHGPELATEGIDLDMNANKTEYMSFKWEEDISTLNGSSLKLGDKYSVLSTESDVDIYLTKVWTAINRLSIIWKADLSDKIKLDSSKLWLCHHYCMDAPNKN